jgi:RNA polymerase sigma factor (sigma-70 family)
MKSSSTLAALVACCRKLARQQQTPDAQLLRRMIGQRDDAAFEELVERYAPLVWGVCRRIVSREADCEDAFQAAFLVLFRRVHSIDPARPLGPWLHGVAVRTANKAKGRAARHRTCATVPEMATTGDVADELGNRELFCIVDEEISRLPSLLQAPFVLCCLEGRTRDEAAAALDCSVAAIKSRLERSRNLLRKRLERRGFGLPAAFLVLGLTGGNVRASLRAKALQSALGCASPAVAALVPAAGASLTSKLAWMAICLVTVGACLSFSRSAWQCTLAALGVASDPPAAEARDAERPDVRSHAERGNEKDRFGDPLPPGAVRRFGTLRFRCSFIYDLAFTPDGKQLIAGFGGEPLSVFDAATGRRVREVGKVSPANPRGFTLSPDGKRVACCAHDLFVWDLETGKLIRELDCKFSDSVAFSPDGKRIAAAKIFGAEVILMEIATGKHLGEWKIKEGQPLQYNFRSPAFSSDGKYLAGIFSEGREVIDGSLAYRTIASQLYLLDAATGKLVRTFGAGDDLIDAFAFQPGTGRLAGVGKDGSLRFWDAETGKELRRLPAIKGWKYVPLFTADGRRCIAVNSEDGFLAVVDARDGRELRRIEIDASTERSVIALSADGRAVAEAKFFGGRRVRVWDIESGVERLAGVGHNDGAILSLSTDGRTLISREEKGQLPSRYKQGQVFHWDLRTGEGRRIPAPVEKEGDGISWLEERKTLRGRNWLLTIAHKKMEMEVRSRDGSRLLRKIKYPAGTRAFAFSPDGAHLAIAFQDRRSTVFLWDPEKEDKPRTLSGHPDACQKLLFSHDGKRLIAGAGTHNDYSSPTVWIWDTETARLVRKLATNSAPGQMLLTADDRVLLTGGLHNDATVHAWDMDTGKELACLVDPALKHTGKTRAGGHWPAIWGLALSADERFLAIVSSWGNSSSVSVWETSTWKPVRAFAAVQPSFYARSMVFSRDGRSLFVSNSDSTILEWDVSGRWASGRRQPAGEALNRDRLNILWRMLAEAPDRAYPALWEMLDRPAESVAFLREKLSPIQPIEKRRVRQLLEKLDAEAFAEREEANRQLLELGEQALPVLRQALNDRPALETKKRIERVIDELTSILPPDQLRLLRALAVLEWSNRPEAGEHLRRLAGGDPAARLTRAAKAAMQRR